MTLTIEQRNLLVFMGKPDDGSQLHVTNIVVNRICRELMKLGFVYRKRTDSYDLTDEGERLYGELTGDKVG